MINAKRRKKQTIIESREQQNQIKVLGYTAETLKNVEYLNVQNDESVQNIPKEE